MRLKVKRFGARGAHIIVPNSWLNCDVEATVIQSPKEMSYSKEEQMSYSKPLDEAEIRFLDMFKQTRLPILKRQAEKEFGKDRVKALLEGK